MASKIHSRRALHAILLGTAVAAVALVLLIVLIVPFPGTVTLDGSFRLSYPAGLANISWRTAGSVQFLWGAPSHLPAIVGSVGVVSESNGTTMYSQSGLTGRGEFVALAGLVYRFSSTGGSGGGISVEWTETYMMNSPILD
ncbi:MAG: hypothetical protein WB778_03100 [Thermoplasmata archaeon]